MLSVLIGLIATLLYIPAFAGLALSVAHRSPVLSLVAAFVSTCAMVGFGGVRAVQGIQLGLVQSDIDRGEAVALIDSVNPILAAFLVLFMVGTLVGLVMLVIAVWRTGRFPRAALVLVLAFVVFDMVGGSLTGDVGSRFLPVLAHLVFLVGLGWLGLVLWRQAGADDDGVDQQWRHRPAMAPSVS